MGELGIDLAGRTPRAHPRTRRAGRLVVTMGCGDECPFIPGKRYLDWDLPDPKGRPIDEVRATRDEIRRRATGSLASSTPQRSTAPRPDVTRQHTHAQWPSGAGRLSARQGPEVP